MQTSVPGFAKFLYTHNPFYLLSASLVLYGLHAATCDRLAAAENVWLLAGSLCGYTLLLALTAYLVVRLGRVWEDARSLALLVILMFVAVSVSFDEICGTLPATAALVLALGLIFSILVSEGLIRFLEIKFPFGYRLPLYLTFGLFFLYPLWVSPHLTDQSDLVTSWRVLAFPLVAGAVTLTLLPAVRRGSSLLRKNGTPWEWPWYPWPVFFFLAVGICFRSYALTLSFQAAQGLETSFSFYYLVPLLLSILVVLSEIGFVENAPRLQRFVLLVTPGLLLMAVPVGHGEPFALFLGDVVDRLGSPLWIGLLAISGFYAYLWARGLRAAEWACLVTLLLCTKVGPRTIGLDSLPDWQCWPFVVIGTVAALRTVVLKDSVHFVVAGTSLIAALTCLTEGTWFTAYHAVIPGHLVLAMLLVAGFAFSDRWARLLKGFGPLTIGVPAIVVAFAGDSFGVGERIRVVYVASLAGVALGAWLATRDRRWQLAAIANATSVVIAAAIWVHTGAQQVIPPRALAALAGGLLCFAIAVLISAIKGGIAKPFWRWLDAAWRPLPPKFDEDPLT